MELGLAALAIIALVVVVFQQSSDRGDLLARFEKERQTWVDERRELVNRIQHPERMPTKATVVPPPQNISPEARRALHRVGKVAPQVATDGD